jgi:Kef-type K+ transport system membrane component KefB
MSSSTIGKVFLMLTYGVILVVAKIVYLFFDMYNIVDFIVFLAAGMIVGKRLPSNQKAMGLLVCLPASALCVFFVLNLGYTSIVNGIGTAYAVSLIVMPVACSIGIYISARLAPRRTQAKK